MNKYYIFKIYKDQIISDNYEIIYGQTHIANLGYIEGAKDLYRFFSARANNDRYFGSQKFKRWCELNTCSCISEFEKDYKNDKYMVFDYKNGYKRPRDVYEATIFYNNKRAKSERKYISRWNHGPFKGVEFRKDPVPFTGRCLWFTGFRSFQKVKDDRTIEQKELEREFPTAKIKVQRPCRNAKNMPSAYDDISCTFQKTWKKSRKTQYKQIKLNCRNKDLSWDYVLKDADEASFFNK